MSKITELICTKTWSLVKKAARRTIGKDGAGLEPTPEWKAKMLLAEHSPIRELEFHWTWVDIRQWVTAHLVRHHEGCEKYVHSQRSDRNDKVGDRDQLPQGALNEMDMTANAQALINISRKRLCACASPETREAWKQVKSEIAKTEPILAEKMVRECVYRGFCPEFFSCCGYCNTQAYQDELKVYRNVHYDKESLQSQDN